MVQLYKSGVLPVLCGLLSDTRYRQLAADALLQIVESKGSKAERVHLLDLFKHMDVICQCGQSYMHMG